MTPIIVYQAKDGARFNTEHEAVERDSMADLVSDIMAPLGEVPEAVRNGKGWLQHNPETVLVAKEMLFNLFRDSGYFDSFPEIKKWNGREVHPSSFVGRIIDDGDESPMTRAWHRLGFIDVFGREHQQPFYANNGPLPYHVCVEDRSKS